MKKCLITALLTFTAFFLSAQHAAGCFELVEGSNGTVEVRFNVSTTSSNSNTGANNRMSRGELTLSWTGSGEVSGFTNGEYNWVSDGETSNSVQYRFGPVNQITTFVEGESILLLTISISEMTGTLNIVSSDLINLLNVNLASESTCTTSLDLAALPVNLSFFTADVYKSSKAILNWETLEEFDNDYFLIEHSTNGIEFREVGKVFGNGTRSSITAYEFLHNTPVSGVNFYRLNQVDLDGSTSFSEIQSVHISGLTSQISVFPNPATSLINIDFAKNATGLNLQLLDSSGRQLINRKIEANTLRTTLLTLHYPKGTYWLRLSSNDEIHNKKVIIY